MSNKAREIPETTLKTRDDLFSQNCSYVEYKFTIERTYLQKFTINLPVIIWIDFIFIKIFENKQLE